MSQEVDNIQPSYPLFRNDEYKESLANKREAYEERHPQEKIDECSSGQPPRNIRNSILTVKH